MGLLTRGLIWTIHTPNLEKRPKPTKRVKRAFPWLHARLAKLYQPKQGEGWAAPSPSSDRRRAPATTPPKKIGSPFVSVILPNLRFGVVALRFCGNGLSRRPIW